MNQQLDLKVEGPTLSVRGDVDLMLAPVLIEAILSLARCVANHEVDVDMGQVTFIDSTGVNALITAHRGVAAEGKELVLHNVPTRVQRVFVLTGVEHYLGVGDAGPRSSPAVAT